MATTPYNYRMVRHYLLRLKIEKNNTAYSNIYHAFCTWLYWKFGIEGETVWAY